MFSKEPTEILDYQIDWIDWLGDLVISSSSWSIPAGITSVADDHTSTTTRIRLSGGTWGETYELTNTILASNESETRSILIRIQRSVAYCSSTEVRRRAQGGAGAGGTATPSALTQAELEALIEQASRMFDRECGVPDGYFNPVTIPIPTTRVFYGDGTSYLKLPPYVPGSLNTSLTLPSNYTVPDFIERNGRLVITDSAGVLPPRDYRRFDTWPCSAGWYLSVPITISAIWGFRETPADVKAAVIELVLNLWRETDPASVRLVGLEGQPLRERMPPRVISVARKYRRAAGAMLV